MNATSNDPSNGEPRFTDGPAPEKTEPRLHLEGCGAAELSRVTDGPFAALDRLVIIGTNYRKTGFVDLSGWTIPVPFRGFALQELRAKHAVSEAIYLSTCNRSELILWAADDFSVRRIKRRWREWAARAGQVSDADSLRELRGRAAAAYLFRVAASLDSLVLGETEILRQLREAQAFSVHQGHCGPKLRAVFERSLKTGRDVRQQTSISTLSTSVAAVAMKEIRARSSSKRIPRAVIVGAGETSRSMARLLRSNLDVGAIAIANRTLENAEELARDVKGTAHELAELPALIAESELVLTAVNAPRAFIDHNMVGERRRPLLLVDLAIPPNVKRDWVDDHSAVSVLGLDEIEDIAAANRPLLDAEARKAEHIVDIGLGKLLADLNLAQASTWIRSTRDAMQELASNELSALFEGPELAELDPAEADKARARLDRMVNRLMHIATHQLKQQARASAQAPDRLS